MVVENGIDSEEDMEDSGEEQMPDEKEGTREDNYNQNESYEANQSAYQRDMYTPS